MSAMYRVQVQVLHWYMQTMSMLHAVAQGPLAVASASTLEVQVQLGVDSAQLC